MAETIPALSRAGRTWSDRGNAMAPLCAAAFALAWCAVAGRMLLSGSDVNVVRQAASARVDALWHTAVTAGLEPAALLLARISIRLFGESLLGVTAHSAGAFAVLLVCAYLLVRQRASRACAWWAVLVVAAAVPVRTAFDARAYTMIGATTGVAFVCWQRSTGQHRVRWLTGLTMALSCAVYLHPIGALVVLCIAAAMAFQAAERRRVDVVASAAVAVPLLFAVPFAGSFAQHVLATAAVAARAQSFAVTAPFHVLATIRSAYIDTLRFAGPALLFLTATALFRSSDAPRSTVPRTELAAAIALALLPVWAYGPAEHLGFVAAGGAVFPVLLGYSYVVGWLGSRAADGRPLVATAWTAILLCAVAANLAAPDNQPERWELRHREGRFSILQWEDRMAPRIPIVIPDFESYVQLAYYAPPSISQRLVHIRDLDGLNRIGGSRDFYVFEAAYGRSPLFESLAAARPDISEARSWMRAGFWGPQAHLYRLSLP